MADDKTADDDDSTVAGILLAAVSLREKRLEDALRELIHEVTHLSPPADDGSHWCKISREALSNAREAINAR